MFVKWLYTQKSDWTYLDWAEAADVVVAGDFLPFLVRARLKACAFGGRIIAPAFEELAHNTVIDLWCEFNEVPCNQTIICAFEQLPLNDKMLDFIVRLRCMKWDCDKDTAREMIWEDELPHAYLLRMLKRYGSGKAKEVIHVCAYHQHVSQTKTEGCPKHGLHLESKTKAKDKATEAAVSEKPRTALGDILSEFSSEHAHGCYGRLGLR